MTISRLKFSNSTNTVYANPRPFEVVYLYEYPSITLEKEYFRNFLRINNRKKEYSFTDFKDAGYPSITMQLDNVEETISMIKWCDANFGKYKWFSFIPTYVFQEEKDLIQFKMTWL